eukprot:Skav228024  [mRNA]  locus=scaffold1073:191577:200818:- [translate_table: standard]
MCPIIGPRFKCTSCEDVSLCRICYKRRLEVHKPGHRFFAMKPMLGVSPDATEKLKEMKRKERDERDERENEEEENQGRDKEVQREDRQELKLEQSLAKSQQTHSVAITEQSSLQGMQVAFEDAQVAPSFLPIHFAPPVQPTDAPEVASKLQERWQNIGQDYKKSWQGQEPKKTKEQKAKDTKAEQITLRVGKQLLRGSKCGLCLQQADGRYQIGVICFRKRPDGSEGGQQLAKICHGRCGKGICFPCMLRASSMMFGKAAWSLGGSDPRGSAVHFRSSKIQSTAQTKMPTPSSVGCKISKRQEGEASSQWLAWMRATNLQPDVASYNAVLKQRSKAKDWERSLELLKEMGESKIAADIITLNTVIDGCVEAGKRGLAVDLALSVHRWDVEVDELTCSSVLQAFQEKGNWQKALSLLNGMPELDLVANEFCFANAMTSCVNSQEWEWAFHLFNTMHFTHLFPDAACYSAAMGACSASDEGQWELALSLLNQMVNVTVAPNDACFTEMLASLWGSTKWTIALELLSLMTSISLFPTRIQFNAAIKACASSEWRKALELLAVMQQVKLNVDQDTLGSAMEAYQTASQWQSALAVFRSIPSLQIVPGYRSYNNILNVLYDVDYGEEIWREAVRSGAYPQLLIRGRFKMLCTRFMSVCLCRWCAHIDICVLR